MTLVELVKTTDFGHCLKLCRVLSLFKMYAQRELVMALVHILGFLAQNTKPYFNSFFLVNVNSFGAAITAMLTLGPLIYYAICFCQRVY